MKGVVSKKDRAFFIYHGLLKSAFKSGGDVVFLKRISFKAFKNFF